MNFEFESHIDGETCQVSVIGFDPGSPAKLFGPPENCCPAEDPTMDLEIFTESGDAWPEELSNRDRSRIESEAETEYAEIVEQIRFDL